MKSYLDCGTMRHFESKGHLGIKSAYCSTEYTDLANLFCLLVMVLTYLQSVLACFNSTRRYSAICMFVNRLHQCYVPSLEVP